MRSVSKLVLASLMIAGLAACGGGGSGGGGGGGGSGNNLTFTPDKTSLSFDVNPGIPTPSQNVSITASGTYSGTIYIGATATGQGLAASIPITISGVTATAVVSADTSLPTGTYSGKLDLMACSDAACKNQIGNSPVVINFTVTVHPPLVVSPTSISATSTSGVATSQAVTITLPSGVTTSSAAVTAGSQFATITNETATGFTVSLAALPSGTYTGSITVIAGSSSAAIPISYVVSPSAGGDVPMSVSPTSLTLLAVQNGSNSAMLTVTPPGWNPQVTATVEYPTGAPTGWLSVTPVSGGYQVSVSGVGLADGSYTGSVRVHGAYPAADIVVPVSLTVGPGLTRPADITVTMNAESTASIYSGSVPVTVATGPAVSWTATSDAPWLEFSKGSGTTGESLVYQIDATQAAALANATSYPATIKLTPNSSTLAPVSFNLTLAKQLPEITSLAPYTQVAGQAARVVLRGSGFAQIASPAARVLVQGATATNVTVVNDTEMVATLSPLAAGNHIASVSNALGLATSTRRVTAVTPTAHTYWATPTGVNIRTLIYDAEREAVLAVNSDANTIMRFTPGAAGAWSATSVSFPGIGDIGLSIDGAKLFATTASTTAPGVISVLDPVSLATSQSAPQATTLGPDFTQLGFGIQTTNDGRTWIDLETSGPPWSNLAYVTVANLTPTIVTPSGYYASFYGGPWFARSRDGERLLVVQSAQLSPQPPMLYLDAADGILRQNAGGATFSYQMSLDDVGDRAVFDGLVLRDGLFNVLGHLTIPAADNYTVVDAQLSPDGTRIYALSYSTSAGASVPPPRVYVFDATVAQTNLTILGYFTIADYPSCPVTAGGSSCTNYNHASAISIDGQTLYYAGVQNFIVVPTNTPFAVGSGGPRVLKSTERRAPTPWPLSLH